MYQLNSKNYWSDPRVPVQLEYRNPQASFPLHLHDFHEITVIFSGSATHVTAQGMYKIQEGDVVSIKPGQSHGYKSVSNLVLMNILVKQHFFEEDHYGLDEVPAYRTLFGRESRDKSAEKPIVRFRLDSLLLFEIRALIESISRELSERRQGYEIQVITLFIQILLLLMRSYTAGEGKNIRQASGTIRLVEYIERNFHSPLSMGDLIKASGMSESRILRTVKQITGYAPLVYINKLRIDAACAALLGTDKSVTEIALDAGFNDSNYFSRCFRKHMGITPREFRRKNHGETDDAGFPALPSPGSTAPAEAAASAGKSPAP